MRVAVIDPEGCLANFPTRLKDEGADVKYYVHPRHSRHVGENLVPLETSMHALLAWCKQGKDSLAFFLSSGMGKHHASPDPAKSVPIGADDFRRAGVAVVGGGSFCDRLEQDRAFGEKTAKAIGCKLPPTHAFSTVSDAAAFVRSRPEHEAWFFKSNRYLGSDVTFGGKVEHLVRDLKQLRVEFGDRIACVVQQKIEGVALSTACWWNGLTFVPPFEATIEYKKHANGNLGPSTGCALNAVWFYEQSNPRVIQRLGWEHLGTLLRHYDAPPALYDINAIVDDKGDAYFLEWTPRLGIDSEPTSTRLFDAPLVNVLEGLAYGKMADVPVSSDLAYSVRLSVPPYPFEGHDTDKGSAFGRPINGADGVWDKKFVGYGVAAHTDGSLYIADRLGLVGLSLATGRSLSQMHTSVIDYAKSLVIKALHFRTDGLDYTRTDAKRLAAVGYEIHPALLR